MGDGLMSNELPRLTIDWTQDGHGIVLDTSTTPATIVGLHDLPAPDRPEEPEPEPPVTPRRRWRVVRSQR